MSLIHGWGPNDSYPMNIEKLPLERLSRLSFLFGGVGDGKNLKL